MKEYVKKKLSASITLKRRVSEIPNNYFFPFERYVKKIRLSRKKWQEGQASNLQPAILETAALAGLRHPPA